MYLRPFHFDDHQQIADLHTRSWRSAYRTILRPEFLQHELPANRLHMWRERLQAEAGAGFGILAADEQDHSLLGFAWVIPDYDAQWGSLLDNLHVDPDCKGRGIGRALLAAVCRTCELHASGRALHLWAFAENHPARRFYENLGAKACEETTSTAPGGGEAREWRYAWQDWADLSKRLDSPQDE